MKRAMYILAVVILLPALGFSASFKVYPGAKLEDIYEPKQSEIEAKMSKAPKVIIFTTNDPFESVVAFYRGGLEENTGSPAVAESPPNSLRDRNLKKPTLSLTTRPTLALQNTELRFSGPV